ncbi:retinal-specific phospholipid-transporting ATPase ABCA4-like [Panonychus citri]|uniref:retinal-specific phospholipid-transporting ATPase ABCA4-like n=1 Tax=Panonychus citri TaxID=50023 RepID=UPI002306F6E0|nr:retinal-specific phospholipid-transporting ATPase ABCA4-like [Panonychus citri]
MERVDLTESENTLVSALSGGMKRRIQLALALSMKSEILILDEPTSGIDPESRRQIWNLLLKLRKDYTILLTTHHMEEADALGDRIIIMSSGKIKCSGSSMFLKKQFGAGYSIRIAKDAWVYKPSELGALITKYFEEATVTNETNLEIIYHLNDKSNQESMTSLANLCDDLDNNPTSFGITSYGVSVTTLEDVFIKVAEDEADKTIITMEDKLFGVDKILDYQRLTGSSLLIQRIKALLMKRFHYTRRHFKTIGFTLIIPALVMMFIFYTSQNAIKYVESITDYPYPIELNAKQIYGSNVKSVIRASFTSKKNQPFIDSYRKSMKSLGIQVVDINSSLTIVDYLSATSQNADQFMKDHVFGIIENDPLDPAPWSELGFSLWYNPKASLSLPLTVDAYTNALLRLKRPELKSPMLYTTYMPMPNRQTLQPKYKSIIARILSAMLSPVAFCLIAVSFFLFPSTESQNKVNLIQKMSGIKAPIFWFSHYIFDLSYNMMIFLIVFLSIIIIDQFLLISFKTFASFMVLFMLFGLASIPLSYLFSFLPLNRDTGFSSLAGISVVSTLIGSALAACLVGFGALKPIHFFIGNLFPPFAMSFGLSKIYGAIVLSTECKKINACPDGNIWARDICCENNSTYITYEPFSWENDGIYPEILILLLDIFLYTIVLIVLDMNLHRLGYWYESNHQSLSYPNSENDVEDKDVVQERDRVKSLISSSGIRNEALIVDDLTKDFESSRAVDRITFGVHKAECFGLLGVNGAGKTTTFRMLTGDIIVTSGEAYIGGYSLRKDLLNFQKSISYCPQSDALLDHLTPVESLMLFARIRGMPESKVKDNVNYLIESTDLTPFANICNKNLSGGNKRKLSLAIASIAKPEVIFLDEPTTGVDPASRRKIWSTLIHLRDTIGSSIVLTSHSMDECEALCSRIGIMARGNFKCLGSSQHLKEKFGFGFTLKIKMSQWNQSNQWNQWNQQEIQLDKIKIWMAQKFPSSILRDVNKTILHYHLRDNSLRWGQMLRCLDEAKRLLPIEDFTLTGTTLEQIFLSFSK